MPMPMPGMPTGPYVTALLVLALGLLVVAVVAVGTKRVRRAVRARRAETGAHQQRDAGDAWTGVRYGERRDARIRSSRLGTFGRRSRHT